MSWETLGSWLAAAAAFAAIMSAVLLSSRRLETRLGGRIDKLDSKIDRVEQRLDAKIDRVEAKLGARIDGVEARLEAKIDQTQRELVEFRLETREEFGRVHAQLGRHEEKLALWERYIWARSAPELFSAETPAASSITPKPAA